MAHTQLEERVLPFCLFFLPSMMASPTTLLGTFATATFAFLLRFAPFNSALCFIPKLDLVPKHFYKVFHGARNK